MKVVVTGGAGFIGSELVRQLVHAGYNVIVLDKLTYAANIRSLPGHGETAKCRLIRLDLTDANAVVDALSLILPDRVFHLAAESHVDRSIMDASEFLKTNVVGTHNLLQACRPLAKKNELFRFLHVSTDEVYGPVPVGGAPLPPGSPYRPSSPYAASKAAADQFVHAWQTTYDFPAMIAHSSNNYGPWQYPEKLIPLTIQRALQGEFIPVYGEGLQRRTWLHVADHARGLQSAMEKGEPGNVFHFSGVDEKCNIDLVHAICNTLDRLRPKRIAHRESIRFMEDRPGHDDGYAIDSRRTSQHLGWNPQIPFDEGLESTVLWYIERFR